jgi:hypothetical protein
MPFKAEEREAKLGRNFNEAIATAWLLEAQIAYTVPIAMSRRIGDWSFDAQREAEMGSNRAQTATLSFSSLSLAPPKTA